MRDQQVITHTFHYVYHGKRVDYRMHLSPGSTTVTAVVLLGTVQIGDMPLRAAMSCPPNTVIVQGAPHWMAKPDGSDVPEFVHKFTHAALRTIYKLWPASRYVFIAESQSVPSLLRALTRTPLGAHASAVLLLQPLGFTHSEFGNTPQKRITELKKRVVRNSYHQIGGIITDKWLRYNHRLIHQSMKGRTQEALVQYDAGMAYNALPDLLQLHKIQKNIHIIAGEFDAIFPPKELSAHICQHLPNVTIHTVRGVPHVPLGTHKGKLLLQKAFTLVAQ